MDGSHRYYESSCSSEQVIIILQLGSCNQQLSTFALTISYALYKRVYIGNIVVIVNSSSLKLVSLFINISLSRTEYRLQGFILSCRAITFSLAAFSNSVPICYSYKRERIWLSRYILDIPNYGYIDYIC